MSTKKVEARKEILSLCVEFSKAEMAYMANDSELNASVLEAKKVKLAEEGVSLVDARKLASGLVAKQYLKG